MIFGKDPKNKKHKRKKVLSSLYEDEGPLLIHDAHRILSNSAFTIWIVLCSLPEDELGKGIKYVSEKYLKFTRRYVIKLLHELIQKDIVTLLSDECFYPTKIYIKRKPILKSKHKFIIYV